MNQKGFTLIELMIVIAIIGILAAIAIPNFLSYRQKGFDSAALSDAKNAYTAAQAYFTDHPDATLTLADLSPSFRQTDNVTVAVTSGAIATLEITSFHSNGTKTYTVHQDGSITP